jgi:hypothetical protein
VSICVFLGPTLSVAEARSALDAEYLPPAAVGDVYRAARKRPDAIAIIDGYFSRTPAIWHKEVLWAMSEGVHVLGSSSMGALRAAELADFGMKGIGKVFEAYRSGALVDDDEVAVAHASPADGYRALSDAMVNVRATLQNAASAGVLGASTCLRLEQLAKDQFYPERSLRQLPRLALQRGLIDEGTANAFEAFLPKGRVDQKRLDALALLEYLQREREALREPKRVSYVFEHTHTWEELLRDVGTVDAEVERTGDSDSLEQVELDMLDQLRLDGRFLTARRAALGRVLALEEVARMGRRVNPAELRRASDDFRRQRGLFQPTAFRSWMDQNELDISDLEQFLRDEASIGWLDQALALASEQLVLDHLRFSGDYPALRERAVRLGAALLAPGAEPELPVGVTKANLWTWYFDRIGRPVPDNITAHASSLGFVDAVAFQAAVLKQFLASQKEDADAPT